MQQRVNEVCTGRCMSLIRSTIISNRSEETTKRNPKILGEIITNNGNLLLIIRLTFQVKSSIFYLLLIQIICLIP